VLLLGSAPNLVACITEWIPNAGRKRPQNFLAHISFLFALADAQWERAGSKAITLLILGRFQETFLADAKPNSEITT
jgi:hypothetical protein